MLGHLISDKADNGGGKTVFRTTLAFRWAEALVNAMLTALAARPAAALIVTPKVLLYSNDITPGPNSAVADFTPCAFTGYTDATPTFTAPVDLTTVIRGVVAPVSWIATTATPYVSGTAIGYILYDGATAYYGGERFQEPVAFGFVGSALFLNLALPLPLVQASGL